MSTLMPFESMGVMTMKMMSITSITSTIGVTLMSDIGPDIFCFFMLASILSFARRGPAAVDQLPTAAGRVSTR
jgi:hypothetical protein